MSHLGESSTAHLRPPPSPLTSHHAQSKQHDEELEAWKAEEAEMADLSERADSYIKLHDSVQSSTTLLDSLSTFLSTFQTDLSEVSGHIADLQGRSKEIDKRLRDRQTIAQPLNTLISSLVLPPDLIALIRDTQPGDAWLPAIVQLEEKLVAVKARGNVKAAHEVAMVVEGLKAKATASLRSFLLNLLKPIRASVRTNIQVVQSSILLKYLPFFQFLQRQAPKVAAEVQRAYVVAARAYYETCFRRYARALGVIKARTTEKRDLIGTIPVSETAPTAKKSGKAPVETYLRLKYATIEGEAVTLAYRADEKDFKQPVEALFRSLLLVLMDNASAEFTFVVRFFSPPTTPFARPPSHTPSETSLLTPPLRRMSRKESSASAQSFNQLPDNNITPMDSISEYGGEEDGSAGGRPSGRNSALSNSKDKVLNKDTLDSLTGIWKQVMEPGLEYCQTFFDNVTDRLAPPPAVPLMTMIRLNDAVLAELGERGCTPMETFSLSLKLALWPLFQKEMDAHVESIKKLTEAAVGGGLGAVLGRTGPKNEGVQQVCLRYAIFYSSMVALSEEEEDQMLFGSLLRLRTELQALIKQQASKIKVAAQGQGFLAGCYGAVISELEQGNLGNKHLREEIGFWEQKRKAAA